MAEGPDKPQGDARERRRRRAGRDPVSGDTTAFDVSDLAPMVHGPRPTVPLLVVVNGVDKGRPIIVSPGTRSLGRGPLCDVSIQGRGISRTHARVRWDPSQKTLTLEDAGSTNGVYVQGTRTSRHVMQEGDIAYLGPETALKLEFAPDTDAMLRIRQYENSIVDDLTGVHNRRYLMSSLEHEMAFARRHEHSLCLMLVDIDHFKKINDEHGHAVGDTVIQQLAGLIADSLRAEDSFARLGGEEFAVVSRGLSADGAISMAERLRKSIEAHAFQHEDMTIRCTVSVGGAMIGASETCSITALLKRADENLYQAKNGGRNRTVVA